MVIECKDSEIKRINKTFAGKFCRIRESCTFACHLFDRWFLFVFWSAVMRVLALVAQMPNYLGMGFKLLIFYTGPLRCSPVFFYHNKLKRITPNSSYFIIFLTDITCCCGIFFGFPTWFCHFYPVHIWPINPSSAFLWGPINCKFLSC